MGGIELHGKGRLAACALGIMLLWAPAAKAEHAYLPSIELVMTGGSSSGNDQVWVRVAGQPSGVPADCVYGNWSLFYVAGGGALAPDKALSVLLTAKATNKPVSIQFGVAASASDFWGFGITKCRIDRVAMH